MEVSKDNVKDSQLQLEGLYRENSPEGEDIDTASQLSGKKRYAGTNTNHSIDTSKL